MKFNAFKEQELTAFDDYMRQSIKEISGTHLEESMHYSLYANGKRLRPLLLLATLAAFHIPVEKGYGAAAALEMIHTYSLIHDDLPAMDDDDLRRGLPTNHLKYDEATAILAGDGLLTHAFNEVVKGEGSEYQKLKLVQLLSETAGYKGMIGGQMADILGENQSLSLEELEMVHARKTGELLRFALESAGILSNQADSISILLGELGIQLGIAYQIRDDILDITSTEEELGKPIGSDEARDKSTYPALLGLESAYQYLDDTLTACIDKLDFIEQKTYFDKDLLVSYIEALALKES